MVVGLSHAFPPSNYNNYKTLIHPKPSIATTHKQLRKTLSLHLHSTYNPPKKMEKTELVLILDFGSQYTHLITRRIRSLSVFSLCISGTSSLETIASHNPRVVILSGGPHSVHAPESPSFPAGFLEWAQSNGIYVLGVCYGLQLMVQKLGGVVRVGEKQEYGRMDIVVEGRLGIFGNKKVGEQQVVWMSHGDEAASLPDGFEVVARSQQGAIAAVENREKRLFGLQYHPEVFGFASLF